MTRTEFWELIAECRRKAHRHEEGQVQLIGDALLKKPAEDIVDFVHLLQKILAESFTVPLWEACYLINLNDREDTFEMFRAWLILQGKEAFELIQQNPDALIDHFNFDEVDKDFQLLSPELLGVGFSAWEEVTGEDPADFPLEQQEIVLEGTLNLDEDYLREEYPLLWDVVG
jgi:hypothetical protein